MEAGTIFVLALSAVPMPIAFFIGDRCQTGVARRLLRYGAIVFAILLSLAVLFLLSCDGNLLYGLGSCGPWDYTPSDAVQAATGLVFAAYVVLGPVLVIAALIFELRVRRIKSRQTPRDESD